MLGVHGVGGSNPPVPTIFFYPNGASMKIGVCGIACEACPSRVRGTCPNGEAGCRPKDNPFCAISTCALRKGVTLCFGCADFPCETTKKGPLSFGYCQYIAGKS